MTTLKTFAAIVFLILASNAIGQTSGSVVGTVTDSSHAVIPKATVTLLNKGTNIVQTTTTSESGEFRFPIVAVGQYQIAAEIVGFQKSAVENVLVDAGQATRAEIIL